MPAGRPTSYKPEILDEVTEMAKSGATDIEIADSLSVSVQTLYNWRAKYPEFLEALKGGKAEADERVVNSLYKRATGFEHDSVKIFCGKDGDVTQVPFREYIPPDTTAAIFWLKNRRKDEWRDKSEVDLKLAEELASKLSNARKRAKS
jgi:hypothetical protein